MSQRNKIFQRSKEEHDERCEAEWIEAAKGYTSCECQTRRLLAGQLDEESEIDRLRAALVQAERERDEAYAVVLNLDMDRQAAMMDEDDSDDATRAVVGKAMIRLAAKPKP